MRHGKKKPPVFGWRFSWIRSTATGSNPLDRLRREMEQPEVGLRPAIHGSDASMSAHETPRPCALLLPAPKRLRFQRDHRAEGAARGMREARRRREAHVLLEGRQPG